MPDLPEMKVGIISCSGEEITEGTISRLAALRVLEHLRPQETVTICLPLFLAGGQGDRAFAKFHPTITIDGCDKKCAARSTEMYSNKPAASFIISQLIEEAGLDRPAGKRRLDDVGKRAVEVSAQRVALEVDDILGKSWSRSRGIFSVSENKAVESGQNKSGEVVQATCSCGSGIPVQEIQVGGKPLTLIGLPFMFETFASKSEPANEDTARALLEMVKIYNALNDVNEDALLAVLLAEYVVYLRKSSGGIW